MDFSPSEEIDGVREGSLELVAAGGASAAGGWGFGVTAPPLPSTGHAGTADGHITTADAAIPAKGEESVICDIDIYIAQQDGT